MVYNEHQLEAINTEADKLLCLAGAGTGKTASMIARICRLVEEGVSPESILVLTFTNAAAFEMKERYLQRNLGGTCPEFRTFHSFCYHLISRDRNVLKAIGYCRIPTIAEEADCRRVEKKASAQTGIPCISGKKKSLSSRTMRSAQDAEILRKAQYRIMRQENLITFDYLCKSVCNLFINDDTSVTSYKEQFQYVFVDEFQDTDKTQWEFVSSFTNSKLFVVGDALQAIYGFRGADSSIIKEISKDPSWTVVKLSDNYRSTKPICDFANSFSTYADDEYRVAIDAKSSGECVYEYDYNNVSRTIDRDALSSVLDHIKELNTSCNHAILFRTNSEVSQACDFLDELHINYVCGKQDTDPIHILKSVSDNKYALDWLSIFLNAGRYTEWIRVSSILEAELRAENANIDPKTLTHELFRRFKDEYGDVKDVNTRLIKIMSVRSILRTAGLLNYQRCRDIFHVLGLEPIAFDTDATTVKSLCDYLVSCLESAKESQIYVGTVHSVKGLEYDNVYLMNVDGDTFPINTEENKNLFYVGITRAKSRLMIYYGG